MADDEFPFRYVVPVDPNIGRRVDVYFVLRVLLGKGGMGAAYLAEHEALGHIKCVIKLVLAELARHPMAISRYKTEAEALSLLKHDNIVKLHGIGVLEDGQLFLRFEYVEGRSLDRYVADHGGRLPLRKAAYFIFQLCAALQYAHDRGVIHRDLKPDNLMVEANPPGSHLKERVKILDFGIAKVVASAVGATGSGIQMGTPKYMAPEQVTNAAAATGRADVFSLGQVLYKIVTGDTPWGTPASDIAIYHKQRTEPPAWPPEDVMPRAVAEVVRRTFSLNPDDRPTMYEFAIDLACAIAAERGEESGTEILAKVVPDWVTSSAPDAQTLPHPVAADPANVLVVPPLAADGPGHGREGLPPLNVGTLSPKAALPEPVPYVTPHARPHALARSAALVVGAASRSPDVALEMPATPLVTPRLPPIVAGTRQLPRRPPQPLLAALPTGLASQRFAAQEPPSEALAPQAVVAAEIRVADGTPGPPPYAHSDLPAVVVSNSQLSGLTSPATAPVAPWPGSPEPPPFVVLPGVQEAALPSARSARGKLIVVGAAACALAALAAIAVVRLVPYAHGNDARRSATSSGEFGTSRTVEVADPHAGIVGSPLVQLAVVSRGNASIPDDASGAASGPVVHPASEVVPVRSAATPEAEPSVHVIRKDERVDLTPEPDVRRSAPPQSANAPASSAKAAGPSPDATSRPASSIKAPASPPVSADRAKNRSGVIIVRVPQTWAQVWIDQVNAGTTPVREKVPPGLHKVLLVAESHRETVMVNVTPGRESVIERNW